MTARVLKRTYSHRERRATSSRQRQADRKRAEYLKQATLAPPNFEQKGVLNFLGLPGDIRNMIYAYMIPDGNTVLAPKRHSGKAGNASKAPKDYLRFAHVCKQIRWEFFPLWYKPHVIVRGHDLARFTRDFVLHGQFGQSNSAVDVLVPTNSGQGVVDFLPFLKYWRDNDIHLALNVKYTLSPRITVAFKETVITPYEKVIKAVVDLLGPCPKPAEMPRTEWQRFFDKAVRAVLVSYEKGPRVKVVVRHKFEEWWMSDGREGWQKRSRAKEWFQKHGLWDFKDEAIVDIVGTSGL